MARDLLLRIGGVEQPRYDGFETKRRRSQFFDVLLQRRAGANSAILGQQIYQPDNGFDRSLELGTSKHGEKVRQVFRLRVDGSGGSILQFSHSAPSARAGKYAPQS